MKKIFYIMTAALVLGACAKELDTPSSPLGEEAPDAVYPDGAKVTLTFSVPVPPATKGAMADTPNIDNMFVAVFDGSGALKEYEEAEMVAVTDNGTAAAQTFKVSLLLKSSERRLHFIANGPAKSEVIGGGMESTLLQKWTTENPNAAFWQRIVLKEGVTAYSIGTTHDDGTAWTDGEWINFYYTGTTVDEVEVYSSAKVTVSASEGSDEPGLQRKSYRVSVSGTRASYMVGSQTVSSGDFVNAKGEKILDGTGYFQSYEVSKALSLVPLVRNFARIKIVPGDGNFTPTSFALMNIPNKGTLAPYSTAVGGFSAIYTDVSKLESTTDTAYKDLISALDGSGYPADMPSGATLIQTKEEATSETVVEGWKFYNISSDEARNQAVFLYERGLPSSTAAPVCLLVGGNLSGQSGTRWFKIELTDADGKYFRIYRDVTYSVEIGQIDGSIGYGSAYDAAIGTAVSDVSNSVDTENLTQVSDGKEKGSTLWVEYIDYVGNNPSGEDKRILYKIFDTDGKALSPTATVDGVSTPRYTLTPTLGDAIEKVSEDAAYSGTDTPDGKNGWRVATVTLAKPSTQGAIYKGSLTISAITQDGESKGNGKTLSRVVKYNVMGTQNLKLSATNLETEAAGQETTLTIELPEGLGFSMFPLVLKIEPEKGNLNPVAAKNGVDLPVETGTSYFSDKNAFYFLYTINWSDYYDRTNTANPYSTKKALYFTTTKDYSASGSTGSNETLIAVTDKASDDAHYFYYQPDESSDLYNTSVNRAICQVLVDNANSYFTVTPLTQTVSGATTSATFSIKTNASQSWTVSPGTNVSKVSSASGSGNAVITVNFAANTLTSDRDLEVYVTPNGGIRQTVWITQRTRYVTGTASFTYSDFSTGTDVSATKNDVKVTFSSIYQVLTNYRLIGFNNNTVTMTVEKDSNSTKQEFKLTGVNVTYYNSSDYYPTSVSSNPTGFSRSGNTGSWSGSTDGNVVVSMTKNGYFYISGITITYSYMSDE